MIEFTMRGGKPCAINPRYVTSVRDRAGNTYIAFGSAGGDVIVVDTYADVLAAILAAQGGHDGPCDIGEGDSK